jgi:predicted ArsR family transcriptional regulator
MDRPVPTEGVLAQPSRARLFAMLAELRRAAGTDELAGRMGLHPNGVRLHLERLRAAGLVTRERARQPRGRPRDMWSLAPDAAPGGRPPSAYEELGRWLTRALAHAGPAGQDALAATGREVGRALAADGGAGGVVERLRTALAAQGFQPRCETSPPAPPGSATVVLANCPYRAAAREERAVVCALHREITRGLLEALAPDVEMTEFVPRDPDLAGCTIGVRGPGLEVPPADLQSGSERGRRAR